MRRHAARPAPPAAAVGSASLPQHRRRPRRARRFEGVERRTAANADDRSGRWRRRARRARQRYADRRADRDRDADAGSGAGANGRPERRRFRAGRAHHQRHCPSCRRVVCSAAAACSVWTGRSARRVLGRFRVVSVLSVLRRHVPRRSRRSSRRGDARRVVGAESGRRSRRLVLARRLSDQRDRRAILLRFSVRTSRAAG